MKKATLIFTIVNTILLLGIAISLFAAFYGFPGSPSSEEQVEEAYKKALDALQ